MLPLCLAIGIGLHPASAESPRQAQGPQAWQRYAMAVPENSGRLPMIAIVMDDVGIAPNRVEAVLSLPLPVTVAVLPYAPDAANVANEARARGLEVLLHLPMQPLSTQDPGPQALLGAQSAGEFDRRLLWNLSQFEGYIGVNNHMGSFLTQDQDAMARLHMVLAKRGLIFLDSRTAPRTVAGGVGRSLGVPVVERDIFLDNVISPEGIRGQLQKVEDTARRNGAAIAIGHPHEATLTELRHWAVEVEARGFILVPLSAMLRRDPVMHSAALPRQ